MDEERYTIGFANLDERNPFAVRIREGIENAASQYPNIDLMVRDNALDLQRAKDNIEAFVSHPVNLAIVFHIDERQGANLIVPLTRKNIPVISLIHGIALTTFLGLDNVQAGQIVGEELTKWIQAQWNGQVDRVIALINQRAVKPISERISAALEVLQAHTNLETDHILYLDDGGLPDITYERIQEVLQRWDDLRRIVIIALGDHIALGALEAARDMGREEDVIIGGMDGIQIAEDEFNNPDSRLLYSLNFDTGQFGEILLDLALRILQGERVPRQQLMPPNRLTR
jgi:ABC-type sugar transport system substrate-binding protein